MEHIQKHAYDLTYIAWQEYICLLQWWKSIMSVHMKRSIPKIYNI